MEKKSPYQVVKSLYFTEKTSTLIRLRQAESNSSVRKFDRAKYVFLVDKRANKNEIAKAIEAIYSDKNIKVDKVNTIYLKPKKRRMRGRVGFRPGIKKAIITLAAGDLLEEVESNV